MLLTLEVLPGRGLAYFTLGMSLFDAVNLIRKRRSDLSCVEVKYANQALLNQDIVINFPEHGFHLRFDPRSQRLRLIEVYDVTRLQVKYGKSLIGGASHPATFVRVYDICGPTYPGEFEAKARTYTLHYPGLAFLFPIPPQHAEAVSENHIGMPLEFHDGSTPLAARICIYTASEASSDAVASAAAPPAPSGSLCGEVVEARVHEGLRFCSGAQAISFGDSPQDVWSELGAPSSTAAKSTDSMLMQMRSGDAPGADYFYTYHSRGLDILFDGQTHKVKKFVLHTNVPGHPDFNVYAKCNFMLVFPSAGTGPLLEPLGSGAAGMSGWDSNSATDLTVSSREPSGSCSAGSSSLFGLSNPISPPASAPEQLPQEFARDSSGHLRGSQDNSFWNSLSTLGNDLFSSPNPSPAGEDKSPELGRQMGGQQQAQVQMHLSEALSGSEASATTAVKSAVMSAAGPNTKAEEEGPPDVADARDGWDFDCDFEPPDTGEAAAANGPPQGDQGWVGFGTPTDVSAASRGPLGVKEGQPVQADRLPNHHVSSSSQHVTKGKSGSHGSSSNTGEAGAPEGSTASEQLPLRPSITADSTWEEISAILGDAGRATIHSRGFASNPFGPTLVYGYRGVAFEALKNGHLAGLTLFQA
ncbi:hypothetical protein CVIRNUC_009173 [Coccomyxa viridis]|uniref:Uncharacterized protein n=1 Tax=Coccomyxa viridis TaxID=1274662 RepID=A0AAV1IIV2_9CHLO|nr:hypothetical protein CVIRNUC_009173 [Coccomyxa viridis]